MDLLPLDHPDGQPPEDRTRIRSCRDSPPLTEQDSARVDAYVASMRRRSRGPKAARATPRPRGRRPRVQATRSSVKSGDSGDDGPGEPPPSPAGPSPSSRRARCEAEA